MKNIHGYPDHDKEIVLKHIDRDKEREKKMIKYFITRTSKTQTFQQFLYSPLQKSRQ